MDAEARDVFLLLADISGYTRYMLENRTAALHSQGIITDLLEAVIAEVELPLEVSKLEGDAVFMVAGRDETLAWTEVGRRIGSRLDAFVTAFNRRLEALAEALACPCAACRNLDRLRLKVVAHAGQAVRHRVGRFEEWTGVDVILVHRLLKNRVGADSYLLLTEPAFGAFAPPEAAGYEATELEDKDLGRVPLRVRLLEPRPAPPAASGLGARIRTVLHEARWWWRARRRTR